MFSQRSQLNCFELLNSQYWLQWPPWNVHPPTTGETVRIPKSTYVYTSQKHSSNHRILKIFSLNKLYVAFVFLALKINWYLVREGQGSPQKFDSFLCFYYLKKPKKPKKRPTLGGSPDPPWQVKNLFSTPNNQRRHKVWSVKKSLKSYDWKYVFTKCKDMWILRFWPSHQ